MIMLSLRVPVCIQAPQTSDLRLFSGNKLIRLFEKVNALVSQQHIYKVKPNDICFYQDCMMDINDAV